MLWRPACLHSGSALQWAPRSAITIVAGGITATGTATGTGAPSSTGATSTTEIVPGTAATMDPVLPRGLAPPTIRRRGRTRGAPPSQLRTVLEVPGKPTTRAPGLTRKAPLPQTPTV